MSDSNAPTPSPSFALSVDELRALARLVDAELPPALQGDDEPDESDDRVDLAALRGLLARGLVDVSGGTPVPHATLAPLVTSLGAPTLLAEIERDGARGVSIDVVLTAGATTILLTETGPGIWTITTSGGDPSSCVGDLVAIDQLEGPPAKGEPFEVRAEAHEAADDRLLDGDADGAVAILAAAGVSANAARAWVSAVAGRQSAVAVRVARSVPGEHVRYEAGELRWLIDGAGGCWRVDVGRLTDPQGDGAAGDEASVVVPVAGAVLHAEMAALLGLPGNGVAA